MLFESLSILCVYNNSRISFYTLILAFRFLHRSHFVLPIIDGEAGAHGKKCSFGKQYTGKEYDTAYECINRGRTVCIIWGKYIQLGSSEGYCTNAQ